MTEIDYGRLDALEGILGGRAAINDAYLKGKSYGAPDSVALKTSPNVFTGGRVTVKTTDPLSFVSGPGTAVGAPPTGPTAAAITGDASLTGVYKYCYTEADNYGETPASPIATVTLSAQNGQVTFPVTRTGMTSRRLYRTKAGGSTFFLLPAGMQFGDGYYQSIINDNTADSALTGQPSPPVVDGTQVYNFLAAPGVSYFRKGPDRASFEDITILTATDVGGGLAVDCYGPIRTHTHAGDSFQSIKVGRTGSNHLQCSWLSDNATLTPTPVNVFTIGGDGLTAITANAAGTSLRVAPSTGPSAGGTFVAQFASPADTAQPVVNIDVPGANAAAYGLYITMGASSTAPAIYISNAGSGKLIRDSAGKFQVNSDGTLQMGSVTSFSFIPWLSAASALVVPLKTPGGMAGNSGSIAVNTTTLQQLLFYNGSTQYALVGTRVTGTVTLAAGTSGSIANANITSASIVKAWSISAGGTVGALSVTLAAGVGFTINSTSGADTSKVYYEVVQY